MEDLSFCYQKAGQKQNKNTRKTPLSYILVCFFLCSATFLQYLCISTSVWIRKLLWNECPYCHHLTKFQLTVQDSSKMCEQDYFQMQLTLKMYSKSTPVMLKSRVHKTNLLQSKILKTQILKNSVYFMPPVQAERSPVWAALLLR